MDGVELRPKLEPHKITVTILRQQFTVTAKDNQEARKLAAWKYRKKNKTNDPITFLTSVASVRSHEDRRIKYNYNGRVDDILKVERERRFLRSVEGMAADNGESSK